MSLQKKKKPTFNVMNLGFFKSVKARWRKPRGVDNKKRIRKKFAGAAPRVGYRNPPSLRYLHPLGKLEILVNNLSDLDGVTNKVVRVAAAVGNKKKLQIIEKAKQLKLDVLNPAVKQKVSKENKVKGSAQVTKVK
ncbi:MAG: eL32 family ribosomal protein [Candidatus Micrarchaeota archaeon]|nr:eL32 family ribosomal protein [Candidatus Micrarchaeota archaeon]